MGQKALSHEKYISHTRNGMTDEQICNLYNLKNTTLKEYKTRWRIIQEEAEDRQYFLIAMRKAAGLSIYELASLLGMRVHEYIELEESPNGIRMEESTWCWIEVNLREYVMDEIRYKRKKRRNTA